MSRPNSSDPHTCLSEGGASRVAKLICAGSCGAIQGAKTANTIKQTTKTHPIAASGFRLASRGSEMAVVAMTVIAEASLANCSNRLGFCPILVRSCRLISAVEPETPVFYGDFACVSPHLSSQGPVTFAHNNDTFGSLTFWFFADKLRAAVLRCGRRVKACFGGVI